MLTGEWLLLNSAAAEDRNMLFVGVNYLAMKEHVAGTIE